MSGQLSAVCGKQIRGKRRRLRDIDVVDFAASDVR
jgi:hypothetical protein